MIDALGRLAIRFALTYVRRRYRRQIRVSLGLAALTIAAALYLGARNVPEG